MARKPTRLDDTRARLLLISRELKHSMPEARVELNARSPWELLIATILSAQCTDQRVNQVTPELFRRYRTPAALAKAKLPDVEHIIRSTGFFKSKAQNIVGCGLAVTERYGQQVPQTMEALVALPGVGRKTANVLLGNAFGKPAVIVDTHVKRVSMRLGLTKSDDPEQVEKDLQELLPPVRWTEVSQRLLLHGRYICVARKPLCGRCPIYDYCPSKDKIPR